MQIQGIVVKQDFFPFDLGRTEIVFGVDWLGTL